MPTYTVTDGQSQSFDFGYGTPDEAVAINASGLSSISISISVSRSGAQQPVHATLNLAPNAQVDASFSGLGYSTLSVGGDATTTVAMNRGSGFADLSDAPGVAMQAASQPNVVGTGSFGLDEGATLEFGRGVASGITVDFHPQRGAGATLKLDQPGAFKGLVNFSDSTVVLAGLSQATDYDFANGVLTVYGGPGDQALAALRLVDSSPEKAGLALRLVGGDVQIAEQGNYSGETAAFLAGTPLTQHVAPPPITQPPAIQPPVVISDGATGQPVTTVAAQPYAGPVAGIAQQVIAVTAQSLNILATVPNLFIRTGGGTDAIQALSGTNVLDGGTGSNFLTAGAGTDTLLRGRPGRRRRHLEHGGEVPWGRCGHAVGRLCRHPGAMAGRPGGGGRHWPHAARGRRGRTHRVHHAGRVHPRGPGGRQAHGLLRARRGERERLPVYTRGLGPDRPDADREDRLFRHASQAGKSAHSLGFHIESLLPVQ